MIYENSFPGSIGFINDETEIFVIKENILNQIFNPHFYLYNHRNKEITKIRFGDIENIESNSELISFLNKTREYSLDRDRYAFSRTYYDDLISEWEIFNRKIRFHCHY